MMANISGNINNANNHISPQLIKHKEDIWRLKSTPMDRYTHVVELNRLMRSQTFFDNSVFAGHIETVIGKSIICVEPNAA